MTLQHDFSDSDYCEALLNLFKPGNGVRPPCIAGRTAEQTLLGRYLRTAQGEVDDQGCLKSRIPHDIVLYGPRGNGKTVLMGQFKETCRAKGATIIRLRGGEVETVADLTQALAPPASQGVVRQGARRLWKMIAGRADVSKATTNVSFGVPGVAGAGVGRAERDERSLAKVLEPATLEHAHMAPLVVAIDEAHKLDIKVGQRLLNLSEKVREDGARFLLVLAGTPNLEAHLGKMDATFWDRSKVVPIGRLSASATRDALVGPLQDKGIGFDPDALARVVADSQAYPYFIQLWGEALCEVLVHTKQGQQITASVADEAWAIVEKRREQYYSGRYNEMKKLGLLDAAERVAGAFAGRDILYESVVIRALTEASGVDEAKALAQFDELSKIGYLWQAPQTREKGAPPPPDIEPGIPSLMTYVSEVVQANRAAVREAPVQDNENQAEDRNDDGGGAPTGMGQGQT